MVTHKRTSLDDDIWRKKYLLVVCGPWYLHRSREIWVCLSSASLCKRCLFAYVSSLSFSPMYLNRDSFNRIFVAEALTQPLSTPMVRRKREGEYCSFYLHPTLLDSLSPQNCRHPWNEHRFTQGCGEETRYRNSVTALRFHTFLALLRLNERVQRRILI